MVFKLFVSGCIVNIRLPTGVEELREVTIMGEGSEKILLINIVGILSWKPKRSGYGYFASSEPSVVSRIKEELDKARDDNKIKAVIFKVASPGGLVSASEILWNEIKKFKEERKLPLVAYISSLGVSGAYYVICGVDRIVVNPGATVGSIGVVAMKLNIRKLSDKVGVEFEVVKGGKHKDMLFFHRSMSDEERKRLQELIDFYYELFKRRVVEGRGDKLKVPIEEIADGSVFSPQKALEIGLVDKIGTIYDAIDEAVELAGIRDWRLIAYVRGIGKLPSVWADTYSESDAFLELKSILSPFGFSILYIWIGNV